MIAVPMVSGYHISWCDEPVAAASTPKHNRLSSEAGRLTTSPRPIPSANALPAL